MLVAITQSISWRNINLHSHLQRSPNDGAVRHSYCFASGSPHARSDSLMHTQRTLRRSTSCAGIGLHSGNKVTLTLRPAPPPAPAPAAAPAGLVTAVDAVTPAVLRIQAGSH